MSGRNRKTLIATAWGDEIAYQTAGDYSLAGVLIYPDAAANFPRRIVAVGNSHASVTARTRRTAHQVRNMLLKSDEPHVMQVVPLIEATAPVVREYFGTHNVIIDALYTPGYKDPLGMMNPGWMHPWDIGLTSIAHSIKGGQSMIRQLAKEGYTALAFRTVNGTRIADFQMTELFKSMNARKKA
jgi:hypothetical protein